MNNAARCFRLRGELRVDALRVALQGIVDRHEVLRTRIGSNAVGEPIQIVAGQAELDFQLVDLTGLPAARRESAVEEWPTEEIRRPFDLTKDFPVRSRLFRFDEHDHVLCLVAHHIVSDGRSWQLVTAELESGYDAAMSGTHTTLPPPPLQYADFAVWQARQFESAAWRAESEYWKKQLQGIPSVLSLPLDRPRARREGFGGESIEVEIPADLVEAAQAVGAKRGATLFMTLLAVYLMLMQRYSGDDTVVCGVPASGRNLRKLQDVMGFFVNALSIRVDFSEEATVLDIIEQTRDAVIGAMDHQNLPFDHVVDAVGADRGLEHNPIFQTMFQLNSGSEVTLDLPGLASSDVLPNLAISDFDLSVYLEPLEDGRVHGWFEFSTELFDIDTIARIRDHYVAMLRAVAAEAESPARSIPFLGATERAQLVLGGEGQGHVAAADTFFHEFVGLHAELNPGKTALEFGTERLTYQQLAERSDQVARSLSRRGAGPEVVVAVMLNASIEAVVTLLGIQKSGAAFVCVDPRYPADWIDHVLLDSGARLLVTSAEFSGLAPDHLTTVLVESVEGDGGSEEAFPAARPDPSHAACVIYTGGSTGRPKGVVIEHRNLAHHAAQGFAPLGLTAEDRFLQFASLSFDAAVEEISMALSTGATLVIRDAEFDLSPTKFVSALRGKSISVLSLPTSYWHELVDQGFTSDLTACQDLRLIAIGGEAATPDRVQRWAAECAGGVRLFNGYAPCECTISTSWSEVRGTADHGLVTVGRPVAYGQMHVLDESGEPAPVGAPGELHIAGAGLARGYLGRPGMTAAAFRPNPFSGRPGDRLYRTGDRARRLPSGETVILGRRDDQVKLRGFRIEPADIEIVLREHDRCRDAVVRLHTDERVGRQLVAYVVVDARGDDDEVVGHLRQYLTTRLPHHMVPALWLVIDHVPRTPSGKLDAARLPSPGDPQRSLDAGAAQARPRDDIELRLLGLWQELLGVEVGIGDDFFVAGGHSLLAVQLVNRIERDMGHTLPVAALFPRATVEGVARILRSGQRLAATPVIRLRGEDDQRSTVLVHPMGGDVFCYLPLTRALPKDLGVKAIRASGLDGGVRFGDMAEMAHDYLERVDPLTPDRLAFLGGWSMGGLIALEMAHQLRERTGWAAPVVAIDATFGIHGSYDPSAVTEAELRASFVADIARTINLEPSRAYAAIDAGRDPLRSLHEDLSEAGLADPSRDEGWLEERYRGFADNFGAAVRYRPRPYDGPVLVFLREGADDREQAVADWRHVAGAGLTVNFVDADHYSIVAPPRGTEVAAMVSDWMAEVGAP